MLDGCHNTANTVALFEAAENTSICMLTVKAIGTHVYLSIYLSMHEYVQNQALSILPKRPFFYVNL